MGEATELCSFTHLIVAKEERGKSIATINEENNNAVWGLIWMANAVIAFWKLGVGWGTASLFLGPFIWFFWLIL